MITTMNPFFKKLTPEEQVAVLMANKNAMLEELKIQATEFWIEYNYARRNDPDYEEWLDEDEDSRYICKNCGCDSHCGETCSRTEKHYPTDGYMEYPIEVCRQCRCEACQ